MTDFKLDDFDRDHDGSALLDEVRAAVVRYVALPSTHVEVAVTLWIVATHAVDALNTAPRLAIRSPEKRCGKSRLLDLVGAMCRNQLPTANVSSAVLYRVMGGDRKPTLIIDEADTIWGNKKTAEQNEDLRGLVNAGFERGRPTLRYDAASRSVEELETFGFVALAGIGQLPDTITDRAVNITMQRRKAGERVAPYRSRRDGLPLQNLRDRVAAWIRTALEEIEKTVPDLPVEDRAADVWEPLVIVADIAGGDWPRLARDSAVALTSDHDEEDHGSDSLRLLADIREVFGPNPFMQSKDLVHRLRGLDDSPWSEWDLTVRKLADRLRPYKVAPRRNETGTARGYRAEDFASVFDRYLSRQEASNRQNPRSEPDGSIPSDTSKCQTSEASKPLTSTSDGLTLLDTSTPETDQTCPVCSWPLDSTAHYENCEATR
ncbi:DUF3631 domain-containing protein [Verrucosispora sp. WMMD1129]|uniref:DUF3631 domain-containing protein n=1 Tax=Verrucosispora sp. WMMD1129 TaxID=3016093 RepID=UPI00249A0A9E|nr:DUF3631 domain-containing protein [Verrucosispora sp. WMMD1129]WFE46280.1 DUF3631 domain-containing protein [Verrucosispora sp. WMMD1129]